MGKITSLFSKLFAVGTGSPLGVLGTVLATGAITISALTFTGLVQVFDSQVTVTFLNYDETVLDVVEVNRGQTAVYEGETPTKPSTSEQTFVFTGWSEDVTNVRNDMEVIAQFSSNANAYEVKFYNQQALLWQTTLPFGSPVVYEGTPPTYPGDARFNYEFIGWDLNRDGVVDPLPLSINTHIHATALYVARLNSYLVTFKSHQGRTLTQQTAYYGEEAVYEGKTPFKLPENGVNFVFKGWIPSVNFIISNLTTVAEFDQGGDVPFITSDAQWQIGDDMFDISDLDLSGLDLSDVELSDYLDQLEDQVPYVGEDGNWWLGDFNTQIPADTAVDNSPYPSVNEEGNWSIAGVDTGIPYDLESGNFPSISEAGTWMIGDEDTGIPAILPSVGDNGNWFIGDKDTNISASEEDLGTPFVAANGNWWIGDNDTGIPAAGFDNPNVDLATHDNIPFVGPNDNWWIGAMDTGIAVTDEEDVFPYIGANDHWWIGDQDTYISAHGLEGETSYPYIGDNGNWFVGDEDTGVEVHLEDFIPTNLPTIGQDGNWWFGPSDTTIPATTISINEEGNWVINGIDTGVSYLDEGLISPYINQDGNYSIGSVDTGITYEGEIDPGFIGGGGSGGGSEPGEALVEDDGVVAFGFDGGTGPGTTIQVCPSNSIMTPIDVRIENISKVYDGYPLSEDDATLTYDASLLRAGERIKLNFAGMVSANHPEEMPVSIGRYILRGYLSVVDANDDVVKCLYQPNITFVGSATITSRNIIINTGSATRAFNNTALTNNTYTITGSGLAVGHTLSVVVTGTQTEVGASLNTVNWSTLIILDAQGNDVTKNYSITYNYGTLVVTFA